MGAIAAASVAVGLAASWSAPFYFAGGLMVSFAVRAALDWRR